MTAGCVVGYCHGGINRSDRKDFITYFSPCQHLSVTENPHRQQTEEGSVLGDTSPSSFTLVHVFSVFTYFPIQTAVIPANPIKARQCRWSQSNTHGPIKEGRKSFLNLTVMGQHHARACLVSICASLAAHYGN